MHPRVVLGWQHAALKYLVIKAVSITQINKVVLKYILDKYDVKLIQGQRWSAIKYFKTTICKSRHLARLEKSLLSDHSTMFVLKLCPDIIKTKKATQNRNHKQWMLVHGTDNVWITCNIVTEYKKYNYIPRSCL